MTFFERGTRFANHEIHRLLGAGRTAAVYEATGPDGQRCALKVINPDLPLTSKPQTRLGQEAEAISWIVHVNVVGYEATAIEDGRTWIRTELVDGPNLRELVRASGGVLPVERAVKLIRQACEGVAAAHVLAIIHRDIKPENLLVAAGDLMKVADFGSAELNRLGLDTTNALQLSAAPYLAPECWTGRAVERSDVYAMAVLLYELVTGVKPMVPPIASLANIGVRHLRFEPPPLSGLGVGVPGDLSDLVQRAMSKDPGLRPSMREMADALAVVLQRLNAPRRAAAMALPLAKRHAGLAPTEPAMVAFAGGGTVRMAAFLDRPASERPSDRSAAPAPSSGSVERPAASGPAPGGEPVAPAPAPTSGVAPTRRSREDTPAEAGRASTMAPTEGAAPRVSRSPRALPALLGGVGAVVSLAAVGAGWAVFGGGRAAPVSATPEPPAVVSAAPSAVAAVAPAPVPTTSASASAAASAARVKAPAAPPRRPAGPPRGKLPF